MVSFCYYLHSLRCQSLPLLAVGYLIRILHGLEYLQEALSCVVSICHNFCAIVMLLTFLFNVETLSFIRSMGIRST